GLLEMAYNPPPTGHVVLVLDNGTTAMTGFQEHPGTGRTLDHSATAKASIEGLARAAGVRSVHLIDPTLDPVAFERLLKECLDKPELTVIVADVALHAGFDVKKSELHGMSQRGGSIASDVRFGREVFSPMVPAGEADFLVAVEPDQVPVNAAVLSPSGIIVEPSQFHAEKLRNKKSLNVALLGALSRHLEFSEEAWIAAIRRRLPEKQVEVNLEAIALG